MSLYNIQQQHLQLMAEIEAADGEITPQTEWLLGLTQEALNEKAASIGYVVKKYADDEDMINREIERLEGLRDAAKKRGAWFKEQLSNAMQQFGISKIETPTLKLSFKKSKAVVVDDEDMVPIQFKKYIPQSFEVSKAAIAAYMKNGEGVPGARLVKKQNLQIK